jgi:CheY-like chemotaxis protein
MTAQALGIPAIASLLTAASTLTFLVVEDREFQRGMCVRTLRRLGSAEVHGFSEGAGVLEAARSLTRPGAILMLDLGMPTLDRITGHQRQIAEAGARPSDAR